MDVSKTSQYKALMRKIKFIIDTKEYFCHMKPDTNLNVPWELCKYSDVNYTGDNDTQKSVRGYIVLINGAVITWC